MKHSLLNPRGQTHPVARPLSHRPTTASKAARALLAASVGVALMAASVASAASPKDFATGGGSAVGNGAEKHFSFSAHAGPKGPSGHVVLKQASALFGYFELHGHVSCLAVSGNQATIGVAIDKGTGTAEGQVGIYLYVEDNGSGASGVPDQFSNSGYVHDASVCPPIEPTLIPIQSGNINVNDAQ
jgi:hypothetical protein